MRTETPLRDQFGLEINGLALNSMRTREEWDEFKSLLHRWQILVVRDQHLSPTELVDINKSLGEPEPSYPVEYLHPDYPEIFIISNIVEDGRQIGSTTNGLGWHTDAIYAEVPTGYTMLYTIESPSVGGETLFANTFAAYEDMSESQREKVQGIRCLHSYQYNYSRRPNAPPMTEELLKKFPDVSHPLVRTHPSTGRKGLYLGPTTTTRATDSNGEVDASLIKELTALTTDSKYTYAHKSLPSDFVIWDNIGLLHSASKYDTQNERRMVYRMQTKGSVPS